MRSTDGVQAVDPEVVSVLVGGAVQNVLVEEGDKGLVCWVGAVHFLKFGAVDEIFCYLGD